MAGVVCPQCGHDDQIRKVPSIVAEGISEVRMSGVTGGVAHAGDQWGVYSGSSTQSGVASTVLAQRLSPPPRPEGPSGFEWMLARFGMIAGILGAGWVLALLCTLSSPNNNSLLYHPHSTGTGIGDILGGILFLGGFFGVPSIVLFALSLRQHRKLNQKKQQAAAQVPHWEQALEHWNHVYYCARDDIVFDPQTEAWCSPAHFHEFLYAGPQKVG